MDEKKLKKIFQPLATVMVAICIIIGIIGIVTQVTMLDIQMEVLGIGIAVIMWVMFGIIFVKGV